MVDVLVSRPILEGTLKAAAALTKRRFIDYAGNHCALGEAARGVSVFGVASGEYETLIEAGIAVIEAGGAVSVGGAVVADANGKAIAATALAATVDSGVTTVTSSAANGAIITVAGSETPQIINGRALDAASADGDFIRVKLIMG